METYHGHVRTPNDAIVLFEACRIGLLPRVQRRLSEKERQQIKSGSVFVWDEREAGMRRWTDGKSWSASRVSGSFLTYREMEGKRGGNNVPTRKANGKSPDGSANGDSEDGEGPDGYRYKADGLMKQSFSITTSSGQHLHLISYFSRAGCSDLRQPSTDPSLRHIRPPKNMYPESTVNETQSVPAVTRGPMGSGASSPYAPAPHTMGSTSPYNRPGQMPAQVYFHPYPPTPPNATPPYPGFYGHAPYPYQQIMYAAPYPPHHPQGHHPLDGPPQPIRHPHIPAGTVVVPSYPSHPGQPQYVAHPPPRAMQATEYPQHQPQTNGHAHGAATNSTLPEQGPQLPAINNTASSTLNKPPTPQPLEHKPQESLAVPEPNNNATTNNAPSPARGLPNLSTLLNDNGAEKSAQSNSRSGSRSPNHAQRPIRELPPERLASNSTATDQGQVDKLNRMMFVRT